MISLNQAVYEVDGRRSTVQHEVEKFHLASLAASPRSGDWRSGVRRAVILARHYASGLLCLARSRTAVDSAAISC